MTDILVDIGGGLKKRFKDMGDGTVAEVISLAGGGGAIGTISGVYKVGQTLTFTPSAGYTVTAGNWTRDGANISGATAFTYAQVQADIGHAISFKPTTWSYSAVGGTTAGDAPGTPSIVATAGNGQVNYTITPNANDGGSAVTDFIVSAYKASDNSLLSTKTVTTVSGNITNGIANGVDTYLKAISENAYGSSSLSLASNIVTPSAASSGAYMIASNKLRLPTDVGQASVSLGTAFTADCAGTTALTITNLQGKLVDKMACTIGGGSVTLSNVVINGTSGTATMSVARTATAQAVTVGGYSWMGSYGTQNFKYIANRERFATTFAPIDPQLLFVNKIHIPAGLVDVQNVVPIQRVEIRKAIITGSGSSQTVTPGALVATVTFGGNGARVLGIGETVASDKIAGLEANTEYFLDVWAGPFNAGDVFPTKGNNNQLVGESSAAHVSTDLSLSSMPATGAAAVTGSATFSACTMISKGWDNSPVALIVGDSTEDLTNMICREMGGRDATPIAAALGDVATGSMNYFQTARSSTDTTSLKAQPSGPTNSTPGTNLDGVFSWFATTMTNLFGQSRAPFQGIYSGHGKNMMNSGGLVGVQNNYIATIALARTYWPGIPWWQETVTPSSASNATYLWTDETQQNWTGYTPSASTANGGFIDQLNAWILAKGTNGATFAGASDISAVTRSMTSAALYGAWTQDAFITDLITATTANASATVTLKDQPAIGALLVIDAGTASNEGLLKVSSVVANGSNWDVTFRAVGREDSGLSSRKVQKAHAAGVGNVKAVSTPDGLHLGHVYSVKKRDAIIAVKAGIRAAFSAYAPA